MGKPEHPEKNLSKQRREPTTNSTHIYVVDAWIWTRATLEGSVTNSAPTLLPIPIPTLAPSYWHRGNHFGFQEWGYYSFRPPPHPLGMFFTAFFYLPNSPAVHNRIYKGVDENNSRWEIISDLFLDCISMEHLCDQSSKERDITYHKQAVDIKYSDSWFPAFEDVHCVGLKMAQSLSLAIYLALVFSNHLKYLHGTDG